MIDQEAIDRAMCKVVNRAGFGYGAALDPEDPVTKELLSRDWIEECLYGDPDNHQAYPCYGWTEKGSEEWEFPEGFYPAGN